MGRLIKRSNHQTGRTNVPKDKRVLAMPPGKHIPKIGGIDQMSRHRVGSECLMPTFFA